MSPGASSVASFGSRRKKAEANLKLKVNALEEKKNALQLEIWEANDELINAQEKLDEEEAALKAAPTSWKQQDAADEAKKNLQSTERSFRAVKRRNEMWIKEIENKISYENSHHEAELADIEVAEDQFLGSQDPDGDEEEQLLRRRSNSMESIIDHHGQKNATYTFSPVPSRPITPQDELSSKVMDLVNLQLQIMQKQQQPTSSDKFLIRQTTGKDLPPFGGDCSEWPAFHAQYVQTTAACGFTPVENLYRLQKALKGKAKEVVQAFLTTPDNVEIIMETLEQQFGNPRFIILALVQKVKDAPAPKDGKPESLIKFANTVKNLVITIQNLKRKEYLVNPQLTEDLVNKLDGHYRIRWGEFVVDSKLDSPTLEHFSIWLDRLSRSAQVIAGAPAAVEEKKKATLTITADSSTSVTCMFCGKPNHNLKDCRKFQHKPIPLRVKWVKENRLCFSCLKKGHSITNCTAKKECGIDDCKSQHHQLLHGKKRNNSGEEEESRDNNRNGLGGASSFCTSCTDDSADVFLRIAPIQIQGPKGKINTYALFDEGATCSLLDAEVAEKLGITGKKEELVLQWTNDVSETHSDSEIVNFNIQPTGGKDSIKLSNVRTVSELQLPTQTMNVTELKKKYPHLRDVPVNCQDPARPVLLLGEDNIHLTIAREVKEGSCRSSPLASRTKLGWVIHGSCKSKKKNQFSFSICKKNNSDQELHDLVKSAFRLESYGTFLPTPPVSLKDERATKILEETTKKRAENRWETGLLWSGDNVHLPPSREMALRRLTSVEKKMEQDEEYRNWYIEKMEYYLQAGYCSEVTSDELLMKKHKEFYLPHFAASNPNKPGKLRLVFDAAAKVNGISLNDNLLTGPDLLNSLPGILMRFRRRKIAFGADVKEMFHQVRISTEDVAAQRFLWRGGDKSKEAKVYQMNSMIFGAACSPCSAQFVMRKNADEWKEQYPEAVSSIHDAMYMDDLADGADTMNEAKNLIAAIDRIQSAGGFPMLKWMSNKSDVLEPIPVERRATPSTTMDLKSDGNMERMLGLYWDPHADVLTFKFNFPKVNPSIVSGEIPPTKREVLKLTMSLFDPLGFIANYSIRARILLQQIWSSEVKWDEVLPPLLQEKWKSWLLELPTISNIRIPRCYSPFLKNGNVTLHIFCDASEVAYAAVGYLLIENGEDKQVSFILGKARVAPLKPLSIPRLELLAAVMAVRLSSTIKKEIKVNISSTIYWSDSRNVVCWIRSDARKYKQFVGHRIGEILENSDVDEWRWIPGKLNPADEATRETGIPITSAESRWLLGPVFLHVHQTQWPTENKKETMDQPPEELEMKTHFINVISDNGHISQLIDFEKYSSFWKVSRVFARVMRFSWIMKIGRSNHIIPPYLTAEELKMAQKYLLKISQQQSFIKEISILKNNKKLTNSNLIPLSPFLDDEEILRVGTRLVNAPVPYEKKYLPILDGKNGFTQLMLMEEHIGLGHGNHEAVINNVRQKFWIPRIRSSLKKVVQNCMQCRINKAVPIAPKMGNLPDYRFAVNLPAFTHCGLDLFGPVLITEGRKELKRYVVLFTCLTTRAVHLEKVHSLTVDSLIMSLRRFMAMRGKPLCLYSDNGTNLTGAKKEIDKAIKDLDASKLEEETGKLGLEWKFIPPSAPHFGGCWERMVRCVKTALYSALNSMHIRRPREEVLETLLSEAANIVNSRPLTTVSEDSTAEEALTPNHFIKGTTGGIATFGAFSDDDFSLRKQWRIAQRLLDHFWKRWLVEYLPTLHQRKKWTKDQQPIKIEDFVYVADSNEMRGEWSKGIVVQVYPGKDGIIRVVDIRTPSGRILKRPVAKCAIVDLDPPERSN
ncbi:unnamed protein product [Orchesella dallaii]|uniref:Integrase catalytic domain-containing protein n=1 Tax=Orchesella dallaii TaxID=48710 RepID=A0ABP1QEU3_9HEXA